MAKPTTTGTRSKARRNYFINPGFQWKYTLAIATGVFLAASLMGIALFGSLHQQARARLIYPEATSVGHYAQTIIFFAVAFSSIVVVGLGCWSIIITHRISGPLFVLKKHFTRLADGRFPRRRPLRKKDEFKDLYEAFWVAVDSLKAEKRAQLATLTEVLNMAQSAAAAQGQDHRDALERIAVQIDVLCNEIAGSLGEPVDSASDVPTPGADSATPKVPIMAESRA